MSDKKVKSDIVVTESNLEEFKKLVRKAIFLTHKDEQYFNAIPNEIWKNIFITNFNGTYNYAERVMLNKFREIENIDTARVDKEKFKIHNIDRATKFITDAIDDKSPILFITDFDNDGSLAQSIIYEYLKVDQSASKNMHVEYAQTVNGNANRGFTVDLVDKIIEFKSINPDNKFLIVTADNGINSLEEQKKIQAKYPNAHIVITDHHNPDPEMVIQENDKTVIFNPHYKPTEFFEKFNISGATTMGVLLKSVLYKRYSKEQLEPFSNQFNTMDKLFKVSNLLDYVHTDPADKPEKDYVITKFLTLQPLLNINNSISKIITGEIQPTVIKSIQDRIPSLNSELLYEEAKNIHVQNQMAKILLSIFQQYNNMDKKEELTSEDFSEKLLKELNNAENFIDYQTINPNFIEQLRPVIFSLTADDQNTAYLDAINNAMTQVFESIKTSEQKMAQELRAGDVITKKRLPNSYIAYTDPNILSIFNRKFLNKVYNDENPGFTLTLDNINKGKVSGSFRSLYDISDILKNKAKLEKSLNVKIETPGHEKAAGFIVKSLNPEKNPITDATIETINIFIDSSIAKIKKNEIKEEKTYLLTDIEAITLIDKINVAIRGNVSNFERITPLLKLTPDTIWTDRYTTKQYSMEDICKERRYGYITININFHGDTVIVPVELVRRIVENGYKDYMSLGYMDGGVFMADRVIVESEAKKVIDLRNKDTKTEEILQVFEKDFKDKNHVHLTRDQIKDNPFFKYSDYGKLNFDLFEKMVIGIIDSNKVDTLAVFDVEANGFGNAKLMNLGSMNYVINPDSGTTIPYEEFQTRAFSTERGEEYLLSPEQISELKEITVQEKSLLPLNVRKLLLLNKASLETDAEIVYYLHPHAQKAATNKKIKSLPFLEIRNYIHVEKDNQNNFDTVFNREIKATMLAYLVSDNDFKVPHEMTNLTGITQEVLRKYGKPTKFVDEDFAKFYEGKKVLFGAHNTPYDARVLRANTKKTYEMLSNNLIYDSALFCRQEKLAYDEVKVSSFENIDGMPRIFFYNNVHSDFNLTDFITQNKNGYYPDRTNNYLLEIENGHYYIVDKENHKKIKLQFNKQALEDGEESLLENASTEELGTYDTDAQATPRNVLDENGTPLHVKALLRCMKTEALPNTAIKYSVEELSAQWMVHSLLLSDEQFDIQHVDLNQEKYAFLKKHEDGLIFFQDNYHFDTSSENNLANFNRYYENDNISEEYSENDNRLAKSEEEVAILKEFVEEFLNLNKKIQQKFADAWMYKRVLQIKDPTRVEVTNDLVDLVYYQTNIPKEKIRVIFDDAIKFKDKHGVDHILQHEGHINGPWEFDSKGDVAFEDKLTLALLAQRKYDSYNHSIKDSLASFNNYVINARKAFDKAEKLSAFLATDSYSYRQGLLYARDENTDLVNIIQAKESSLANSGESEIIKFKLINDVLTPNTAVYAVTHKNVSIDRAQIEEDSNKLSFIVANEQLKNAFQNKKFSSSTKIYATDILKDNDSISIEYKKDLAKRYKYVEFSKKDYQITELLKTMEEVLDGESEMKKLRKKAFDEIDRTALVIIHGIILNYIDGKNRYPENSTNLDVILEIESYINELREACDETKLERVVSDDTISFGHNQEEVTEINFIPVLDLNRTTPMKILFGKLAHLRLVNKSIENSQVEFEGCIEDATLKIKM